jgi:hypothetical protein
MVGKKSEVFRDHELIVIVVLAAEVVSKSNAFKGFSDVVEAWRSMMSLCGPGTIDLELDKILDTSSRKREFEALLGAVLIEADKYGEAIPSSFLNSREIIPKDVIFRDYSVSLVRNTVESLRALMEG